MKKKIILIIFIAILIAVLFLIPKDTYAKIFGKEDDANTSYEEYEKILVYMCDENNILVGVNAYVNSIEEDYIRQKFDVLTKQTGTFSKSYDTTINTFTKIIDYKLENDILELNLSNDFLNSESRTTLEQLVWTFCNDEIKQLKLKVEGLEIKGLNGFYFDKLDKSMGINLTMETSYLFEATSSTIIEYKDDLIIPITYFYNGIEECDFIVSKLFTDVYENNDYDYVIKTNAIIIDVGLDTELSENVKKSAEETLKYNFEVNNIQINGLESVLLEINDNTGL